MQFATFRAMDPADDLAWLAVADWLEEHDQPERAELTRLTRLLRHDLYDPDRRRREDRLMELLAAGVEPCVTTLTNSIGMQLAYIPAGTFLMGSPEDEVGRSEDESPIHEVTITNAFYLGMYEVTEGEYEAVMGTDPNHFSATGGGKDKVKGLETSRFPVEKAFYKDVVEFCEKLSARKEEKEKGRIYRLPTEAEWEYACRDGVASSSFHFGKTLSSDSRTIRTSARIVSTRPGLGNSVHARQLDEPEGHPLYRLHSGNPCRLTRQLRAAEVHAIDRVDHRSARSPSPGFATMYTNVHYKSGNREPKGRLHLASRRHSRGRARQAFLAPVPP